MGSNSHGRRKNGGSECIQLFSSVYCKGNGNGWELGVMVVGRDEGLSGQGMI